MTATKVDAGAPAKMDGKLPKIVTSLPGPKAKKILDLDDQLISPSYTRSYPLVAQSGRGALVEDSDGNVFLDFAAGIAVCATGHCHPDVTAAIQKQAAELIHISGTDFYYAHMVDYAEKLLATVPGKEPKRIFYTNSGTESVEAAMKLARYATRRDKFIAFTGCFHGRTLGSLSLTSSKAVQRKGFGALLSGVFHVPYPNPYRAPQGKTATAASLEAIEEVFARFADPTEVAAIFIEPVQGEGGYVFAPADFLQALQKMCRQHGILLVMDEVQSGMGRTGKWWASEHAGIEPDIVCAAKGIASGMPLGAMIARASLMDWKPGAHASTFGGNPVCIAAAMATFDLLEKKYIENARQVGDFILGRLADWPKRHRNVGEVRGKGLMIGIEFVRDQQTRERAPDLRDKVVEQAFAKGLLVLGCGPNTLRLAPPLVIDEEQAEFAVRTLDEVVTAIEKSA